MLFSASQGSSTLIAHFFSRGFRPFFFFGALDGALTIGLWVPWFLGEIEIPTALSPIAWHQHELLFGYVSAIVAGFLLTAVPNWTGCKPLSGVRLALLFGLWLAGRLAVFACAWIGLVAAAIISICFLPALALLILKDLIATENSRNYKIIVLLLALSAAQCLFYYEFNFSGQIQIAGRVSVAIVILLIVIVGSRVIPNFTANWLRQQKPGRTPTAFGHFDRGVMVLCVAGLMAWIHVAAFQTATIPAGALLLGAGAAQCIRQLRWTPERTFAEPLLAILHIGFFFVPLGFLLTGAALLLDDNGLYTAGLHAWTSGAMGIMPLALMTRATRGHTGSALHAPLSTVAAIYGPALLAVFSRLAAAFFLEQSALFLTFAALFWVVAFLSFIILYAPLALRR